MFALEVFPRGPCDVACVCVDALSYLEEVGRSRRNESVACSDDRVAVADYFKVRGRVSKRCPCVGDTRLEGCVLANVVWNCIDFVIVSTGL